MKVNRVRQNVLPLITAFIWGTSFVAQSVGADYVGPFTFNAARSVVAFLFLLCMTMIRRFVQKRMLGAQAPDHGTRRDLLVSGLSCGAALAAASYFQQKGLETTTSGKTGFITALYIVIVPILGIFMGKKASRMLLVSVPLAVAGLYCLCINETFSITSGDFYVILCSFGFSAHILLVDHFTQRVDGVDLSCVQFLTVALLSAAGALAVETPALDGLLLCAGSIVYVGVLSSGVGYTLQILAQKDSNPTVVALLLSLESVFAALAGAVLLHDQMSAREMLGCVLMLAAVVLAQLPDRKRAKV